jgi:hypothetical protein
MAERDAMEVGRKLVGAADSANVAARLLGGVAVAIHSEAARSPALLRSYEDVDLIIEKRGRKRIDSVASECGFTPDAEFNNLHGLERRTYYSDELGKLDVFIGEFTMCHTISLEGRFEADHPTVPLADLFLTKAQIVELNRKDACDVMAILADHPLGSDDHETINVTRIATVCGHDWGIWRTVTKTLETIDAMTRSDAGVAPYREVILARIAELMDAIDSAPKNTKWRLRSKVGERKIWYELPEDPDRHGVVA